MIRAASKNHAFVNVVVDVEDYSSLLDQLEENYGKTSYGFRQWLAQKAYARTAAYDTAVSNRMADALQLEAPKRRAFAGELKQTLRYGENSHQKAAFYTDGSNRPGVATAVQLQGKELSYNNINDTDAAYELVAEFDPANGPACAIIKHANPCGVAVGESLVDAYQKAFDCDRTSAFGGIVALNQPLDAETATKMVEIFTEVVIAPGASDEAKEIFAAKKNLRLLLTEGLPNTREPIVAYKQVAGGMLVQDKDVGYVGLEDLKVVTKKAPTEQEMADLLFAWKVAKHVKSNAIVYVKDGATVGVGAGQMSRLDSANVAAAKAERMAAEIGLDEVPTKGCAVASDAFFPFPDGLLEAAAAGGKCVIQPGGSMRDEEVIKAADEAGIAMVFTGMRHFRH
jgi:phosphoribosylaminoimidazolecarboxamide formyltransferase/IMP cyclohydrolase